MSTTATLLLLFATLTPVPEADAILQELPHGNSMQIVVTDDLPLLDNGDWQAGFVQWGSDTIQLDPRVLEPEWRYAYGDTTDRLSYVITHEWAHVMQHRAWLPELPLEPWITDPFIDAPAWMSELYASPDAPWWEVHADCVAQVLTGNGYGYYTDGGCTEVQRAHALYPLLTLGTDPNRTIDQGETMTEELPENYISIPEAADYLDVSVTTAYRMIDRLEIQTYRSWKGNRLRVKKEDLDAALARGRSGVIDEDVEHVSAELGLTVDQYTALRDAAPILGDPRNVELLLSALETIQAREARGSES